MDIEFDSDGEGNFSVKATGFEPHELFVMEMALLQAAKHTKDTLQLNRDLEGSDDNESDEDNHGMENLNKFRD